MGSTYLSTDQIIIRPMNMSDLSTVLKVERSAYPIPWSESVFETSLAGSDECWLLEFQGVQCGHAVISNVLDEVHLLNICISPAYGRRGLGRVLLRHLISRAINRKASVFFLEVRASNASAIELYFSEGFNEVGVRPNYYPGQSGREDALLMTLELSVDHYA